jgi:hypothetical protein
LGCRSQLVEMGNGRSEGPEFCDLGVEVFQTLREVTMDVFARWLAGVAYVEYLFDLGEGEPGRSASLNEVEPGDGRVGSL